MTKLAELEHLSSGEDIIVKNSVFLLTVCTITASITTAAPNDAPHGHALRIDTGRKSVPTRSELAGNMYPTILKDDKHPNQEKLERYTGLIKLMVKKRHLSLAEGLALVNADACETERLMSTEALLVIEIAIKEGIITLLEGLTLINQDKPGLLKFIEDLKTLPDYDSESTDIDIDSNNDGSCIHPPAHEKTS